MSGAPDISLAASRAAVDPDAVWAAIKAQESGGNGNAVGPDTPYGNAQGSTQMLLPTAQAMAGKLGVAWNPALMRGDSPDALAYQDKLGRAYFDEGLSANNGDPEAAAAYYFGGPDPRLHGPKTATYVQQVMERAGKSPDNLPSAEAVMQAYGWAQPNAQPAPGANAPLGSSGQIDVTISKSTSPEHQAWVAAGKPVAGASDAMPSPDDIAKAYGWPAVPDAPPAQTPQQAPGIIPAVTGFMANVNRGLGVGDEMAAGFKTASNALTGKVPLDQIPADFRTNMATQRQLEAAYAGAHPNLAALGRGTGNALTVAAPVGPGAAAFTAPLTIAGKEVPLVVANALRGATTGGLTSAGFAALDAGTPAERLKAASDAAVNPVALGIGAVAGAAATPRAPSAKAQQRAQIIADFDKAGVDPNLATVTGNAGTANAAAENPLGFRQRNALRAQVDQVRGKAQEIAAAYGDARGPQITGENVQQGVQDFARNRANPTSFAAKAEQNYDDAFTPINIAEQRAVDKAQADYEQRAAQAQQQHQAAIEQRQATIQQGQQAAQDAAALRVGAPKVETPPVPQAPEVAPQRPVVAPTQTIGTLQQLAGRVNAPNLSNMITDSRVRSILDALQTDAPDVRFNDLRALRTWVRNAQGNPELRQGITSAGLQQLEGALTQDIYNNAERLGGPQALHALQRADDYYSAGSARIKAALQPFADAKSGESAYSRILQVAGSGSNADAQRLLSLKRSLTPEQWGDVAANVVNELGKPSAGAAGTHGGSDFSIANFVTNYNKLSDRSKSVLFDSVGGGGQKATELRAELDNLVNVADRLKVVQKGANASHSGTAIQAMTTHGGIGSVLTAALMGHHEGVLPAVGALGGLLGAGEAMTNPAFVRWLSRAATSPEATAASGRGAAMLARAGGVAGQAPQQRPATPALTAIPAAANALSGSPRSVPTRMPQFVQ